VSSNTTSVLAFENFVADEEFPCVGAKAALKSCGLQVLEAGNLRCAAHDAEIVVGLQTFPHHKISRHHFASLAVLFPETPPLTEKQFEGELWARLDALHRIDRLQFRYDSRISNDPGSPHFGMSFGGHGFYVIGMHPNASRASRRTPCATLVFNPHAQFNLLRRSGLFERIRRSVRTRDIALQGDCNPMLSDHGERSEAIQYSGRQVSGRWSCPFGRKTG